MSLKGRVNENFEKLEKIGFVGIFLFTILSNFFSGDGLIFGLLVSLALIFTLVLYLLVGEGVLVCSVLLLLAFYPLYLLFISLNLGGQEYIRLGYLGALVIYGMRSLIYSIKLSIKNQDFELLTFLMGLFLLISPLAILYGNELLDKAGDFYFYALAFIVATILYNDNLWHRYSLSEKNIIKYIFVIALLDIINTSLPQINI